MKAIVIPEPGRAEFVSVSEPVGGPDDVILQVDYAGLCGSDMNTFTGVNPLVAYPRIPGHEISGTIVAAGADVPVSFAPGRTVIVNPYLNCGRCAACRRGRVNACQFNETLGVQRDGGLRERIAVGHDRLILNDTLPAPHMALVEPLTVGFHAVRRASVAASDTVVVIGGGMIGGGALIAAAELGATVVVVEVSQSKRDALLSFGARQVINPADGDIDAALSEATGRPAADVVIEAVGSPTTFRQAVDLADYAGRVVFVGYAKEEVAFDTKYFNLKELDMFGSRNATRDDFERVIGYLERAPGPAATMISHVVAWPEADGALALWSEVRDEAFKVMIDLT